MNNINRSLVKTQAKQIIKDKVFYLFLISFVVSILTGAGTTANLNLNFNDNKLDLFDDYYDNYYDDYFDNFDFDEYDNPIEGFEFNSNSANADVTKLSANGSEVVKAESASIVPLFAGLGSLLGLAGLILAPLEIALAGMYVALVRRNANERFDLGKEFGGIFKNTFNEKYFNKLVGVFLVSMITVLLFILFIIPGVIFSFSAFFTYQIMNEYPNLKPSEAIKLSKKIVKGNRTELFTYELSFIPWYLLALVTFGLASIYVIPYKSTCDALYYENFRLRALAEGRIVEDDFLSDQERFAKYNNVGTENPFQQNNYYAQNGTAQETPYQSYQQNAQYSAPYAVNNTGTFFTPDFSPINPYNPFANQAQPTQGGEGYYYGAQQNTQQPPQNPYYQQPTQSAQPQSNPFEAQQAQEQPSQQCDSNSTASPQPQETAPSYYNPPQDADSFSDVNNGNTENQ